MPTQTCRVALSFLINIVMFGGFFSVNVLFLYFSEKMPIIMSGHEPNKNNVKLKLKLS